MPPRFGIASLLLSVLLGSPGMAGASSSPAPADGEVVFRDYFGLTFRRPVALAEIPAHPEHYLVVEQPGNIVLVRPVHAPGGGRGWEKSSFAVLRVAGGRFFEDERGLLGLTFHPRFKENGKYYVNYVEPANGSTFIQERQADATRLKDAGKPGRLVLEIAQPYPNHNGGTIGFGPDGFLYVGTGDGGSGGDPENRAQNPRELLGKMLRIDVNHRDPEKGYAVPADNPFVNRHKYRPEIWALGLRNPWKWTFQPETGALWVGDVGQNQREEISIVPRGGNLGWRQWEGPWCRCRAPRPSASREESSCRPGRPLRSREPISSGITAEAPYGRCAESPTPPAGSGFASATCPPSAPSRATRRAGSSRSA
ncbi:MAG: hypothetical protein K0Q91_2353 [Fibrobacteria bacterium]|nr:hypothetical protein [Fibrobacteria bacterium]